MACGKLDRGDRFLFDPIGALAAAGLVVVETLSDTPLYPEYPDEADRRTLDCIIKRDGKWRYSLLSSDRHRMICTFEAPDTESIRASYRRGGTFFSRMWPGKVITPEGPTPTHDAEKLKVVEVAYPKGFTWQKWNDTYSEILSFYTERHVEWVQSYLSGDCKQLVFELNAPDTEFICEIHRRFNLPVDRVWSATVISAFSDG